MQYVRLVVLLCVLFCTFRTAEESFVLHKPNFTIYPKSIYIGVHSQAILYGTSYMIFTDRKILENPQVFEKY